MVFNRKSCVKRLDFKTFLKIRSYAYVIFALCAVNLTKKTMKAVKLLVLIFLINVLNISAQKSKISSVSVNYKVSEDDPKNVPNLSVNIDLAHMDFGGNIDGASFNCGIWGHALYKHRLGIDYTFRYGWLTFGKTLGGKDLAANTNVQLGGMLVFAQRTKAKNLKVVLKSTKSGNYVTTTSLMVPATLYKYKALRGGLYYKRCMYDLKDVNDIDLEGNYYTMGAYAGICFGSTAKMKIMTDNYGQKGTSFHIRTSLDVLLTPVNNVPSTLKHKLPIGGRLLIQSMPSIRRKENKRMYNARVSGDVEIGYRMVDGWYLGATVSIPIARNIKALGYEPNESSKRTAE